MDQESWGHGDWMILVLFAGPHHHDRHRRRGRASFILHGDGKRFRFHPSWQRRIYHRCAAARVRLEHACGDRRPLGGNQPELVSFLRGQRWHVVGYEHQVAAVAKIESLALWLRRSLQGYESNTLRFRRHDRRGDFAQIFKFPGALGRLRTRRCETLPQRSIFLPQRRGEYDHCSGCCPSQYSPPRPAWTCGAGCGRCFCLFGNSIQQPLTSPCRRSRTHGRKRQQCAVPAQLLQLKPAVGAGRGDVFRGSRVLHLRACSGRRVRDPRRIVRVDSFYV